MSNSLHVQEYLLTHSLSQLQIEHGVKTSAKAGDQFFSVNYDQIESKPSPLVNQCRGSILCIPGTIGASGLSEAQVSGSDPVGHTQVVARGMDRFFNHGDGHGANVDFNDPETIFFEKLDGTCIFLWYNPIFCEWCAATRNVPLADKVIGGFTEHTFRTLFEKALYDTVQHEKVFHHNKCDLRPIGMFNVWTSQLDKSVTYVFELTTPLNRIVVQYDDFKIHLLAARITATGEEIPVARIEAYVKHGFLGVPVCPSHNIANLQELLTFVGSKPPFEQEGIVVCDKHFNRLKIKSMQYVLYNKLRDSTTNSPRAVMNLIIAEKIDDVMPVLEPYIRNEAEKMQEGLRKLFHSVDCCYNECLAESQGTDNPRKYFALAVQKRKGWMAPMMDRFIGKCNDLNAYIQGKKDRNTGDWPDSFLDNLVELSLK